MGRYDVRNNKWNAYPPMMSEWHCPGAAVMGGHIYVCGRPYVDVAAHHGRDYVQSVS